MIDKTINKIHQVIKCIKNVIRWLPVTYRDREWDYRHLYSIISFKLKNMQEFFESDESYNVYSKNRARELKIAKNLAKRLSEDSYLENACMWHNKEFEEITISDFLKGNPDKKRKELFEKCCDHSYFMKEQDKSYLFDIMKERINYWWD